MDLDKNDQLPRVGECVVACLHIITDTHGRGIHWYRHEEPAEIRRPDGETISVRFMMACKRCHGLIQGGRPAISLMAGDCVWTEEAAADFDSPPVRMEKA